MDFYKDFSKKELADILGLIQESLKCRSESDVVKVVFKLKDLLSADTGVCALGNTGNIVKIVSANWPEGWLQRYAGEELYKIDPIVKFNYEYFQTHLWSEATEVFSAAPYSKLMNEATDFGLKYGLASGVNGEGYKGSIFSFSSTRNIFTVYQKRVLDLMTPHIHQALVRVCVEQNRAQHVELSSREREVLKWVKEGKTNWEISMILNISERTVKFHVKNVERKLNAVNKAHAIAIAMDTGLVL